MSIPYGAPAGSVYQPPGRVNFGWIGEAFNFFGKAAGIWILGILIYGIANNVVDSVIVHTFPNPNYVAPPGPFGGSSFRFGIQYGANSNATAPGQVLGFLFTLVFGAFQSASLYQVAVKQIRGQSVTFGDLFSGGPYFGNMLLLNVALSFLFALGVFAACLGVFVVGAFFLPAAALVADGRTAGQALSASVEGMKKDWLSATLFVFVFAMLIVASVLPCGLGLFVTIPMLHLVAALAYRDMVGMPGVGQAAPAYGTAAPGVWPPAPNTMPPPPQWGSTPTDAPPAYPGYAPQQTPPAGPSFGAAPPPPSFGTPPPVPPTNPSGSSEEPPSSSWQPRPPQGQ